MHILFLTNFYPPHAFGGQEYSCQQVVEGLRHRGHETFVLTSMHGSASRPVEDDGVSRSLYLEMDFVPWRNSLRLLTKRQAHEWHNLQRLQQVFRAFEPELVFVWGMWNLPRSLARLAEESYPERVVYRFAEYWPTLPSQYTLYWQAPGRTPLTRLLRRLIRPLALTLAAGDDGQPPLQFRHTICVSQAVKQQLLAKGVNTAQARVIHTGLDMNRYPNGTGRNTARTHEKRLRLLYAGRLAAEKGVHTAIQAMDDLINRRGLAGQVSLSLAGSGDREYEAKLHALAAAMGLSDYISFLGRIPREGMPVLYSGYDVLVVPSIWPEPFARVLLEGMASGLAVIATGEGGTSEIIRDGQNGLLFATGDAHDLADKVVTFYQEPDTRARLATAARQTILCDYSEQRMLDEMESYLLEVLRHS